MASLLFILMTFFGCTSETPSTSFRWQSIHGRNADKEFVYRVKTPFEWTRRDPLPTESLADTTKPLCEFFICEGLHKIRITIHNFPSNHLKERIPPSAQIARWQHQFQTLNPEECSVIPQAFSGFSGLLFQGTGMMNGALTTVLGWSMQLAPEHYQTLYYPETSDEKKRYEQMRADFTIKVVGPEELMKKHSRTLMAFARSFELIEDIPLRS